MQISFSIGDAHYARLEVACSSLEAVARTYA